ncbi:MAG: hypothetical protein ABSE49_13000 [Polyangiaceae bacterium]|jgi:hypothetical protein
MRFQFTLPALIFAFGAMWIACRGSSSEQPGVDDAGDAGGDADADAASDEDTGSGDCTPCYQACACSFGDQWPAPQACATYTCGASGMWGPFECLGHGCPPAVDGGADASGDARVDAPGDARDDGPEDAPTDGAIDVAAETGSD